MPRRPHSRARLVFTRLEAPGWSSPRGARVKAYLRYEQARAFGVIASPEACPVYADEKGKLVVTAALERLAVWDVRRGVEHQSLIPPARESGLVPAVTKIARAPGSSLVAAGAADGSIRLWNLEDGTSDVLLKGHKSEVTALRFNASGSLLVSGGKDTNVVVWDVVAEMGLCRLRGHKDQVTDAVFVEAAPNTSVSTTKTSASNGARLVTCGKDAAVRVWDLDTQHCAQTLAHFGAECWSLDVDPRNARLVVGTADERLHVFSVAGRGGDFGGDGDFNDDDAADGDENDETAVGKRRPGSEDETKAKRERDAVSIAEASALLTPMGFVRRADRSRVSTVRFDERGTFLGVQTVGRAVEVYRCRDAREMSKRLKRRAKRRREKRKADKKTEHSDESEDEEGANVLDASDVVDLAAVVRTKSKTRGFAFAPRSRLKKRPGVKVVMAVLTDANAVEEWEIAGADAEIDGDDDGGSKELAEPTRARSGSRGAPRGRARGGAVSERRDARDVFAQGRQGVGSLERLVRADHRGWLRFVRRFRARGEARRGRHERGRFGALRRRRRRVPLRRRSGRARRRRLGHGFASRRVGVRDRVRGQDGEVLRVDFGGGAGGGW